MAAVSLKNREFFVERPTECAPDWARLCVEQAGYTIAPGDTLLKIASAFSVTVNQILKANPGLNDSRLTAGEKILIQTETISGSWKRTDDYLIIEQPNGGFVAFRVSSQTANQLTVFSRTGKTIQFNRIP